MYPVSSSFSSSTSLYTPTVPDAANVATPAPGHSAHTMCTAIDPLSPADQSNGDHHLQRPSSSTPEVSADWSYDEPLSSGEWSIGAVSDTSSRSGKLSRTNSWTNTWRDFTHDITNRAMLINQLHDDLLKINGTRELDEQFIKDFNRATYIVNDEPVETLDALATAIPQWGKRQLLSVCAHQGLLAEPTTRVLLAPNLKNQFVPKRDNADTIYSITDSADAGMVLTAKHTAKLQPIADDCTSSTTRYTAMSIKVKVIFARNEARIEEIEYFYRLKGNSHTTRVLRNMWSCV